MAAGAHDTVLITNPGADLYGSDRMVLETVDALVEAGRRVVVTVPKDGPLIPELRSRGAEVRFCRTPVVRKSALNPLGLVRLALDFARGVRPAVRAIREERPGVVYVSTITAPLWLLVARLLRRRVVCHVHEGEASASRTVLALLNAPLFLAQDLLINSRFSRDVLTRTYPALGPRTHVVYNSVRGPEEVVPARTRLADPCRIVYVGRLSPRKGVDVAVEAVARLHEQGVAVSLDVVGAVFPGYEWFQHQLEATVADRDLGSVVTFSGFQPDPWAHIAAADIQLVPSTVDEPFGNTAVEAALAARPSVVSAIAGLREATDGLTASVLVEPGEAQAIVDAVRAIMADWDKYRLRAIHDAAFAAGRYSASRYGTAVLNVVERGAA